MVRRHEGTAFMAGAFVFPGGSVDATDRALAPGDLEDAPFRVAAARELFEEAGVLLARRGDTGAFASLGDDDVKRRLIQYRGQVHDGREPFSTVLERERLQLALDLLVPFAHWVTPPVDTRRFDTRFFITRVPPDQAAAHDNTETIDSAWMTATQALDRCRRGDIVLPPPTWTTLREIEPFGSVDAALAWARRRTIQRREPKFVVENGVKMLLLPGDPQNPEASVGPPPVDTRFILTNGRWRAEAART